jgi:hypothetical protein
MIELKLLGGGFDVRMELKDPDDLEAARKMLDKVERGMRRKSNHLDWCAIRIGSSCNCHSADSAAGE